MSKIIEVSDEQYQAILEAATKQHESIERFVERIADAVVQAQNPVYYTAEEMFDTLDAYAAESYRLPLAGASPSAVPPDSDPASNPVVPPSATVAHV